MITIEQFKNEVMDLAKELAVIPKEIHIRTMKRKWGSCSSKGRLTFDKNLLTKSTDERYKIIIHELLHLRYPKHNKMFKTLLDAYLNKALKSKL